ncbi:hypothetical protein Aduo_001435 [Ancylostoma duodenale]
MGSFFVFFLFVVLNAFATEEIGSANAREDIDEPAEDGSGMSINQEPYEGKPLKEYESQKGLSESEQPTALPNFVSSAVQLFTAEDLLPRNLADVLTSGCSRDHVDDSFCESYLSEYTNTVKKWASENGLVFDEHFGEACKMLSEVEGLVQMCCAGFRATCLSSLQENIHRRVSPISSTFKPATGLSKEEQIRPIPKEKEKTLEEQPLKFEAVLPANVANALTKGCPESRADHPDCESYFSDYINEVKEWAHESNQVFDEHFWEVKLRLVNVQIDAFSFCSRNVPLPGENW